MNVKKIVNTSPALALVQLKTGESRYLASRESIEVSATSDVVNLDKIKHQIRVIDVAAPVKAPIKPQATSAGDDQ